ncbi:MgtC/SapB family protein [Arenibaculum pallidiluteum]|uniref:MgtC/SapB family protein n=1 Tax=Arenibaculum pallidiluteum TaxID=2812559 RepID=UPI001B3B6130|nr:MgtC/SapB family protein [Arenibaculum pallidiluteum]
MDALFGPTVIPMRDMLLRLGIACLFGMVLGLDREIRGKSAGIRTHMLVALSSAMTMLIALEMAEELAKLGRGDTDPVRAIQGLAQAIGFLCAGIIFVTRADVHGVTTAAGLWMTSTIGMAAGAGQFRIALVGTLLAALIVTAMWLLMRITALRRPTSSHDDE